MTAILPVVLAGGSGTRLWPVSRELHPKQFTALTGEHTLLQETLLRLAPLEGALPPCIVCNEQHRFLAAEQCRQIGQPWSAIILEEAARSTAPAVGLAACRALAKGEDPILLALPSDGYIERPERFRAAVAAGLGQAAAGALATFGVRPAAPETGYGYIRAGEALDGKAHRVAQFVEKPDRATAQQYLASGQFLWNSGIFLFRASAYAAALARHAPAILECCQAAVAAGAKDLDFFRPGPQFLGCPSISIDYAVMEKADNAVLVPLDTGWSDLGSWPALHAIAALDGRGNALAGDVLAVETDNSLVHAESRLVATLGVDGLIVAETADAVLVAGRDQAHKAKELAARLKALSRSEHRTHRRTHRPWGSFEVIALGPGYLVHKISVKPGGRISMQMHRHRSEHWVVVRGTASVACGASRLTLGENQSTYIPPGERHQLGNSGETLLELIEVQVGAYLGEDDIQRFGQGGQEGASNPDPLAEARR